MSFKSFTRALLRRKYILDKDVSDTKLDRCLTTVDLTLLGVGSTLGLGIYVLAGQVASKTAGPAVTISFLIAALASVFAALCYAEFGARVPKAGSAYVYSYVTVGEIMAFIIGWNLLLEYVIGTASVARGYSGYLDYLVHGVIQDTLTKYLPIHVEGLSKYPDFLALGITLLLTVLLAIGVKESAGFNNVFTGMNLFVVLYAVITGAFAAKISNWEIPPEKVPSGFGTGGFFPYGFSGLMRGASMCFYGYVGFDCIATTGEEVKNPQKAIPISIICSLFIVFIAYFGVSTIQTLMWPYYDQEVSAPLPFVFEKVGWSTARWIISIGALAGLSTSLLGSMFPLPRVLSAMANDGLIFKKFGKIHSSFKTPFFATIISGVFAALMAMMFNVEELAAMMSIGTLLAYTLVAASVLLLRYRILDERIHLAPLLNNTPSPVPPIQSSSVQSSSIMTESSSADYNTCFKPENPHDLIYFNDRNSNDQNQLLNISVSTMLTSTRHYTMRELFRMIFNVDKYDIQSTFSSSISIVLICIIVVLIFIMDLMVILLEGYLLKVHVPSIVAICFMGILVAFFSILLHRQPSDNQELLFRVPYVPLIPILSIIVNIYLMMNLSSQTWIRFGVWMFIGFVIYFGYGINHSLENFRTVPVIPNTFHTETVVEGADYESRNDESSPLLKRPERS